MNIFVVLIGLAFGFLIVATGLSNYTVIHDMLLLREPDVFLLMGSSYGVFIRRRDAFTVDTPAAQLEDAHGW